MTPYSQRTLHHRPSDPWRVWLGPSVVIGSVVFLSQLAGLFRSLDDLAYDLAMRVTNRMSNVPAKVLLIYNDPTTGSADLAALVSRLQAFRAMHVALAVPVQNQPWQQLAHDPNVTFGTPVIRDANDPRRFCPMKKGHFGPGQDVVITLPAARKGVYRDQVRRVLIAGQWHPTLEFAIADRLGASATNESFRIRFRGGAGSLPHLTANAALASGLVPELVVGRVVLIGPGHDPTLPGISTPTTGPYDKMTALEFHGHALNTLLTDSAVWQTPAAVNWLIYVCVAAATGMLFERARAQVCLLLLLTMLAVNAACGFLALGVVHGWLPVVEMAAVQIICFGRTAQNRNTFTETAWQRLIEDLTAKLRQRQWPTGFFSSAEPWSQIVSFVHQTLNLQRVIILELPDKEYHVQEVKALNCSLSEIAEQRRDCRRWPYASAVEAKQPIHLTDSRPFLQLAAGEEQYLVPLLFGGELFGFVAVGVIRDEIDSLSEFEQRLGDFADQIAELLYRRRCVLTEQAQKSGWSKLHAKAPETRAYGELVHATHLLERRMGRLENMFDKSPTAAAIYDLFGRLMMVNSGMNRLLQNEGVVASELTTIDLVATLTKRDHDTARRILRRVLTSKRDESIPVTLSVQKGDYLLNVRPMELEVPQTNVMADAPTPFHLLGILCELVDRTDVVQSNRMKEQLAESFGNSLRDDLAVVDLAAKLVVDDDLAVDQRREYGDLIHAKVGEAVATLHECERFMIAELHGDYAECLPVDPVPAIEEATKVVVGAAADRGISIKILRSTLTSRVVAAPKLLPHVFDAVFEFLLLDARDDSEIGVDLEETLADVCLTIKNDGFGVMSTSGDEVPFQEGETNIPEHQRLREALDLVHGWGGQMTVAGEIGSGTIVKLMLRKFN